MLVSLVFQSLQDKLILHFTFCIVWLQGKDPLVSTLVILCPIDIRCCCQQIGRLCNRLEEGGGKEGEKGEREKATLSDPPGMGALTTCLLATSLFIRPQAARWHEFSRSYITVTLFCRSWDHLVL